MSERIPLLADCMLSISYHGIGALATVAYVKDDGVDSEGQFTFTVDGTATTIDCDDEATLAELVAAISALTGWKATPTPGLLSTMSTEYTTALATPRATGDLATTTVGPSGVKAMIFANDYEVMAASATTVLLSSVAIPTSLAKEAAFSFVVDGADAGATGDATMNFQGNNLGADNALPRVFPATAVEASWDTIAPLTAPTVAINGATEVRKNVSADLSSIRQVKLYSVGNADDAVVNVHGWLVKP